MDGTIGKKELLAWAAETSGRPCSRLEELRDGVVILRLMGKIWPAVVDVRKVRVKVNAREVASNWETILSIAQELRLPLSAVDRAGIMAARFKPCYNLLVMLCFLHQLSLQPNFSADFAYPIDSKLTTFLQSTASIECLSYGAAPTIPARSEAPDAPRSGHAYEGVNAMAQVEHNWEQEVFRSVESGDRMSGEDVAQRVRMGEKVSLAVQTDLNARRLEKLLIQNLKARHESTALQRRVEELENEQGALNEGGESGIVWKSRAHQQKGELLVQKLQQEMEDAQRRLDAMRQEKEFVEKRCGHQIAELRARHGNEMRLLQDAHENQLKLQQMTLANEAERQRANMISDLRKLEADLAYEADRIRQGISGEDEEELEQELISLRQLRVIHSKQIRAMEDSHATLQALVEKQQQTITAQQNKYTALHDHYAVQDRELFGESIDIGQARNERERALMIRLYETESRMKEIEATHLRELEDAKNEAAHVSRTTQANSGQLEHAYQDLQTIGRLREEVERLSRSNKFLRSRSVLFDEKNQAAGYSQPLTGDEGGDSRSGTHPEWWLPAPHAGSEYEEETRYGQIQHILSQLHSDTTNVPSDTLESLTSLFWDSVCASKILQQRIMRSRDQLDQLHTELGELRELSRKERRQLENDLKDAAAQFRVALQHSEEQAATDMAMLRVQTELAQANLRDVREELSQTIAQANRIKELSQESDDRRFVILKTRLKESREDFYKYRHREKLWSDLISVQQRVVKLVEVMAKCEDSDTLMQMNEERRDLERKASQYVQEINAVSKMLPVNEVEHDFENVEQLVQEATRLLRSELEEETRNLHKCQNDLEKAREQLNDVSVQGATKDASLEAERVRRRATEKECAELESKAKDLSIRVEAVKREKDEAIDRLRMQLEQMRDASEREVMTGSSNKAGVTSASIPVPVVAETSLYAHPPPAGSTRSNENQTRTPPPLAIADSNRNSKSRFNLPSPRITEKTAARWESSKEDTEDAVERGPGDNAAPNPILNAERLKDMHAPLPSPHAAAIHAPPNTPNVRKTLAASSDAAPPLSAGGVLRQVFKSQKMWGSDVDVNALLSRTSSKDSVGTDSSRDVSGKLNKLSQETSDLLDRIKAQSGEQPSQSEASLKKQASANSIGSGTTPSAPYGFAFTEPNGRVIGTSVPLSRQSSRASLEQRSRHQRQDQPPVDGIVRSGSYSSHASGREVEAADEVLEVDEGDDEKGDDLESGEMDEDYAEEEEQEEEGEGPEEEEELGSLTVRVINARNLQEFENRFTRNRTDPYCRVWVGPTSVQTRHIDEGGSSPIWNAEFVFDGVDASIPLVFRVYDKNKLTDDKLLGECAVDISVLEDGVETDDWYTLTKDGEDAGELHVMLAFGEPLGGGDTLNQ